MTSLQTTLRNAAQSARGVLREQYIEDTGTDPFTGEKKRHYGKDMEPADGRVFPNQLLGYCYENAREMSGQLHDRKIPHHLLYVGLVHPVAEFTETDYEVFANASSLDDLPSCVPRTREELFGEANHYLIEVRGAETRFDTDSSLIVEPVSEVRFSEESARGEVFVGKFPWADYVRLEDSEVRPWENPDSSWNWDPTAYEATVESRAER